MHYQLPSGKVVEMSVEKYLDMSDEDLKYFVAQDSGNLIDDPFHGSTLERAQVEEFDENDFDDFISKNLFDITEVSDIEKYLDADVQREFDDE